MCLVNTVLNLNSSARGSGVFANWRRARSKTFDIAVCWLCESNTARIIYFGSVSPTLPKRIGHD